MKRNRIYVLLGLFLMSFLVYGCNSEVKENDSENALVDSTEAIVPETVEKPSPKSREWSVVSAQSKVTWLGENENADERHKGYLTISNGTMTLDETGNLTGGTFTIDMTSMVNVVEETHISGLQKAKIEKMLKGGEFFDVLQFREATFRFTKIEPEEDKDLYKGYGEVEVKGEKHEIMFGVDLRGSSADTLKGVADMWLQGEELSVATFKGTIALGVEVAAVPK